MNLVGRTRELAILDEAWRRAQAGERRVVMISGEPGIGKTRLLDELAARVVAGSGLLAWGRTTEVGMTAAFWPWLQVLAALEDVDNRAPRLGGADTRSDAVARVQLFDSVAAFLVQRARSRPLALLFDDLHAADLSSLQLLEYVQPLLAGQRVLVAAAARDTDATGEIARVLARIQRTAERVVLRRLERAEVDVLVGTRADAGRVFELSAGNPLFVEELVAAASGDGELRLPALSSVREVIRDRVARLPAHAREALVAAAVVGREFRGAVVGDMLGATDVADRLASALHLGMVAMTTPDRFRFSHALVAEAIADELDPSERARLHLRAAEAIERRDATETSAIAHHLLAAGHLAAEAAIGAAERAAREASSRLAFEDAAGFLERALSALSMAAPTDLRRRIELGCARAEALQHAGQHAVATPLLADLVTAARELGDAALFARVALARGLQWQFGVADAALVALLGEALDRLGPDAPVVLRARLLARLGAAAQPAADPDAPASHGLEAIELARSLPVRDRLDVMYTATGALVDYVPPEKLEPIHREVLALARAEGARLIAIHTQLRLCFTALERVDRHAFEDAAAAHRAFATEVGLPRWSRPVHMLDALRALLDGNFADAARHADTAAHIAESLGDTNALLLHRIHNALARWSQTRPLDDTFAELAVQIGAAASSMLAFHATGKRDAATARMHLANVTFNRDDVAMAAVAQAIHFVGDAQRARELHALFEERAGQIVLASMVGFCVFEIVDHLLLLLAATAGQWDLIDPHAEAALAIATRLASPPWLARIRGDWADALLRRARPGDRDQARALWTEALAEAERMDMPGLVARGRAALEGLARDPATVDPAPATATPDGPPHAPARGSSRAVPAGTVTLTRSGELWTITGFGDAIHVRDSRGMQMIARLVAEPGREVHALDLAGGGDGVDGGDAGELLDATARATYRARLAELIELRDEAEARGDLGRHERATEEIEALTAELERAVGLGGRERRAASSAERARSNVQRRIHHALQQIRSASRPLGEHFAATVKTGTFCLYDPEPGR